MEQKQNPSWWDYQDLKRLWFALMVFILLVAFSHTKPGRILQSQEQVYLSMYMPVSKQTDLKSAQITHMDGTQVKVTLSAFSYNPLGTTGGYTDIYKGQLYLGYTNPNNATPTVKQGVLLHELVHLIDGHYNGMKICKQWVNKECMENRAYGYTFLYDQFIELEKRGWLVIAK